MGSDLTADRRDALSRVNEAFTSLAAGTGPSRLHQRMAAVSGELGHAGYPMLRLIAARAPIRVTLLADQAGLDASTVSRRVADLQEKGLVTRAVDTEDQRASLLDLTPRGRQLLASLREARRSLLEEALADWSTQDVQALADMLLRLGRAFAGLR